MEQMIFSDSQTSVTKLESRVTGIPISDTVLALYFRLNMTRPVREHVFVSEGTGSPPSSTVSSKKWLRTFFMQVVLHTRDGNCREPSIFKIFTVKNV